jgi:hypothetical protein
MDRLKKGIVLFSALTFFVISVATKCPANPDKVKLANGTPVVLRTTEEISSKTKNLNEIVNFEVARDVTIDGKIAIKSGTPATATVISSEQKGMIGKAGKIQVSLEATKAVDGQRVALRSVVTQGGKDEQATSLAGGIICCPLFLLMKGKEATIAMGTEVKAYTETDMTIDVP